MHIAICDDNIADRKQLERMLGREADSRIAKGGVFYTDSFGEGHMLFPKRKSYDLFFIDLVEESENGLDFALELCAEGVTAPIVLCSSKYNYAEDASRIGAYPPNLMFLNKPVLKADLCAVIDKAVLLKDSEEPTIEIRHKTETYYVFEDDIVYVNYSKQGLNVYLKDGTEIPVIDSLSNFATVLSGYTHYARINPNTVINAVYIEKSSPFKVTLKSGLAFPVNAIGRKNLKKAFEYILEKMEIKAA